MMQRALSLAVLAYLCIASTASANGHDSSKSKSPKSESAGNPLVRKRSQRGSLARYSDEYNDEHISGDSSEVDGIFMHLAEEDIYNVTTVDIPKFQLNFTLDNASTERRTAQVQRDLHSSLEAELYHQVYTYIMSKAKWPYPQDLNLKRASFSGDENSANVISTFTGTVDLYEYYDYDITTSDIEWMVTNLFGAKKMKKFVKSMKKNSELQTIQRIESGILSFPLPEENVGGGSGSNNETDPGPGKSTGTGTGTNTDEGVDTGNNTDTGVGTGNNTGTGIGNITNPVNVDTGSSNNEEGEFIVNESVKVTTISADESAALIAGSLAGFAALVLFGYTYGRRKHSSVRGYALSDDHDDDLEAQGPEESNGVALMKSLGLSEIAATAPGRNGNSYMGVAARAWSNRRSMSDLAAGATQEEFLKNGMKIDIYGRPQKKQRQKSAFVHKMQKAGMLNKNSPKGSELELELEAIVEVDSSKNSGVSGDTESWQNGNNTINSAPPLLPAMSDSSAPSDETPLNDITNITGLETPDAPSDEEFNISFQTPLAMPPHDSLNIEGMTPYADMSGISGSPNMSKMSNRTVDTPLNMRCLSFATGSVSDFSASDKSDKSSISCAQEAVTDMLEVINPNDSESSSDGCVKDMRAAIDDCAALEEPSELDENRIHAPRDTPEQLDDVELNDDSRGNETDNASERGQAFEDVDFFCPPEIKMVEGQTIITDEVSGKLDQTVEDPQVELTCANKKDIDSTEGQPQLELSYSYSESESESETSLITVENK